MFFGTQKPYFLGIDFGASLIKAVELTVEGDQVKLVNYGQVNLDRLEKGIMTGENSFDDEVVLYLRALLDRLHPHGKAAYVAMPAFMGLISLVELPQMDEEELKGAIQFEAQKYIPSSLEDVALSWEQVGMRAKESGQAGGMMEILLVAALNKEVSRYKKYMTSANLEMKFLELETFSLVRSVVGKEPGVFLVIDIGSRTTNLVLVDEGLVKVSRNLDAGGKDITRTLVDGLHITQERADILKKSEKDFLNAPESRLVFPTLEAISGEALRMLASYRTKYPDKECREVILSGGTAQLAGLTAYYSQIFSLPVSVGDPWKRIRYNEASKEDVETLGASFSVALGLALEGIDALTKKKDPAFKKPFSLKELLMKDL